MFGFIFKTLFFLTGGCMLPCHISEMVISKSLDEQQVKDQFQMMAEYVFYSMKYFMINILI